MVTVQYKQATPEGRYWDLVVVAALVAVDGWGMLEGVGLAHSSLLEQDSVGAQSFEA